ncbi:MAG: peptide chain release factor N(5)-glutamine methyltransferase [Planctomycetia bacterium]|jgi:release factor glutamine methyltransferase
MADDVWTVGRLLNWTTDWLAAKGSEAARLEAEVLLAHVRGCPRIALYTAFDTPVDETVRGHFRELVKRRGAGEPVAYLVGSREFFSLPFRVTPAVLVPRPETEGLVVRVIDLCKPLSAPRIIDVGTGSAAIAVTLAKHLPQAVITATDVSAEALAVARENAARHGVADRIEFLECDLLGHPRAAGPWDVIVSNPPYIRDDEFETLSRDVRLHEPKGALVSGPTGVEVIERLAAAAVDRLAPGGWLICEIGPPEASEAALARQAGLAPAPTIRDLAGLPRIVQAQRR